jgi:hypothetical protein
MLTADGTPREYLALFRASLLALKDFMDRHLPGCHVILHKARFSDSGRNAQDEIVPFSETKIKLNRTANWNAAALKSLLDSAPLPPGKADRA